MIHAKLYRDGQLVEEKKSDEGTVDVKTVEFCVGVFDYLLHDAPQGVYELRYDNEHGHVATYCRDTRIIPVTWDKVK